MRRWPVVVVALAVVLSACGISADTKPRDIPQGERKELGVTANPGGGDATGKARIYLLGPSSGGQEPLLQPVARTADTAADLITSLLSGPNDAEMAQQFRTAIPPGTQLRGVSLQSSTLRVDLSEEILRLSGNDLIDALAQIVFTASELDGVRSVKLLVNGADQQWPAGNGTLQSQPLTVYDFPGRVASAQPPYPAVPTPTDGS